MEEHCTWNMCLIYIPVDLLWFTLATSHGHTSKTTQHVQVQTYHQKIYYVDFTKTQYAATKTTTLADYTLPTQITKFKLQAVGNPCLAPPALAEVYLVDRK